MIPVIPEEMLEKAIKLHGHLGPFLVLGLKMGLLAKHVIGKPVSCEVITAPKKPYLCTLDGLKTVMGDNITVSEGNGLSARFENDEGERVVLTVKTSLVKRYVESPWEKCEENAREVMRSSYKGLFEF